MRKMITITYCVFKEELHQKLFILLTLFGCLFIPLSMFLITQFPGKEKVWLNDVTVTMMSLVCFFLVLIMGSDAVSRERDRGTDYIYQTNPVRPEIYILGKFFGALGIIFVSMTVLFFVYAIMHLSVPGFIHKEMLKGVLLIMLKSSVLLMYGIFGGMFFSRVTNILFIVLIYLLGSLHEELHGLLHHEDGHLFQEASSMILHLTPDLSFFDKKDCIILNFHIPFTDMIAAFAWASIYCVTLFVLSGIAYRFYHYPKSL